MSTLLRHIGVTIAALAAFGAALTTPAAASTNTQDALNARTAASTPIQCSGDFKEPGINIRGLPNTNSPIRGQGNPGDCAYRHTSIAGERVQCSPIGSSTIWLDVTNQRTGVRGWISSCFYIAH